MIENVFMICFSQLISQLIMKFRYFMNICNINLLMIWYNLLFIKKKEYIYKNMISRIFFIIFQSIFMINNYSSSNLINNIISNYIFFSICVYYHSFSIYLKKKWNEWSNWNIKIVIKYFPIYIFISSSKLRSTFLYF